MKVIVHVFSNGNAIFEFDSSARSSDIETFRDQYQAGHGGALFFVGVDLAIVDHMNPLLTAPPRQTEPWVDAKLNERGIEIIDRVDQDQQA